MYNKVINFSQRSIATPDDLMTINECSIEMICSKSYVYKLIYKGYLSVDDEHGGCSLVSLSEAKEARKRYKNRKRVMEG